MGNFVLDLLDVVQSIDGLTSNWSSASQVTQSNVYASIMISTIHVEQLDAVHYLAIQCSSLMLESIISFHGFTFLVETPVIINRHGVRGFMANVGTLTLRLRDCH